MKRREFDDDEFEFERDHKGEEGGQEEGINHEKLRREAKDKARAMAKHYLEKFFAEEKFHSGGKIPKKILFSERNIKFLLELGICSGADEAHKLIGHAIGRPYTPLPPEEEEDEEDSTIHDDPEFEAPEEEDDPEDEEQDESVVLVISILRKCQYLGIPKPYMGGIFCVYLEVCRGMKLPEFKA